MMVAAERLHIPAVEIIIASVGDPFRISLIRDMCTE